MNEPTDPNANVKRVLNIAIAQIDLTRQPTVESLVGSGLLQDIRANGIRNDPLVRELDAGRYEALAGNGRIACWRELGHDTVRVVCLGRLSKADGLKVIFADHSLTRTMPVEEKLAYVVAMKRELDCTLAEAGRRLGLSPAQVCKLGTIRHLAEPLLAAVYDGRIPTSHAYLLATVRDREAQLALARLVMDGTLKRDELALRVKAARKTGTERKAKAVAVKVVFQSYDAYLAALQARADEAQKARKAGTPADVFALLLARKAVTR